MIISNNLFSELGRCSLLLCVTIRLLASVRFRRFIHLFVDDLFSLSINIVLFLFCFLFHLFFGNLHQFLLFRKGSGFSGRTLLTSRRCGRLRGCRSSRSGCLGLFWRFGGGFWSGGRRWWLLCWFWRLGGNR